VSGGEIRGGVRGEGLVCGGGVVMVGGEGRRRRRLGGGDSERGWVVRVAGKGGREGGRGRRELNKREVSQGYTGSYAVINPVPGGGVQGVLELGETNSPSAQSPAPLHHTQPPPRPGRPEGEEAGYALRGRVRVT